uniref:DUF4351 domain-containing protein n=1 Tax=Candidatus Kentrum sp. FW TaxID=2126338 RepID=A0A450TZL7_9GAMM|nr:MAG: conserved hypothetical protein (putative transposase or invertase) [Candidatus Kentron sp. FW]
MGDKDIVSKEIIGQLAAYLAIYLLDLPIDPDFQEAMGTEHQRIEDRRADLVVKLRDRGGEPFLLHIEIQNDNDPQMPVRMMRYLTDVLLAYPGLPVHQYLIYIGVEKLTMSDRFEGFDTHHRYGLVDMRAVDCEYLIKKDTPEALILAILCDFKDRDPQEVVDYIYTRLQELVGDNTKRLRECIAMLHILSVNRDLKKEIKEAEKVLTQIDMTRIPSYQLGMEKGLEKGRQEGMERGQIALLTRLLSHKFGTLSPMVTQRIDNAHSGELAMWGERVLTAKSLDEVFS